MVEPTNIKSVNCFDLLYLFRGTGGFDEFGWANGSGNLAIWPNVNDGDTRAKLKFLLK